LFACKSNACSLSFLLRSLSTSFSFSFSFFFPDSQLINPEKEIYSNIGINSTGIIQTDSNYDIITFPVKEGENIIAFNPDTTVYNEQYRLIFLNKDQLLQENVVGIIPLTNVYQNSDGDYYIKYVVPAGAKFGAVNKRFVSQNIDWSIALRLEYSSNIFQFGYTESLYNSTGNGYQDFYARNLLNNLSEPTNVITQYKNKKGMFFGDSITNGSVYGSYVNAVTSFLGLSVGENWGYSGSNANRVYEIMTGVGGWFDDTPDFSDADFVNIMIGHNDTASGSYLDVSSISDPNDYPDTLCGNLAKCIEYVWSIKPNIKIYIDTIHQSTQGSGNKSGQINEILIPLANYYTVPVIDVYVESGINKKNNSETTYDGLHLFPLGNERLAKCIGIGLASK